MYKTEQNREDMHQNVNIGYIFSICLSDKASDLYLLLQRHKQQSHTPARDIISNNGSQMRR